MNRREFLRTAGLSAGWVALLGAGILVPERTYFLPPSMGWDLAAADITTYLPWRWDSHVTERYRALFGSVAFQHYLGVERIP